MRFERPHDPLLSCAIETERYVAAAGWDQPPRLFALVETMRLLDAEPSLAEQLAPPDDATSGLTEPAQLADRTAGADHAGAGGAGDTEARSTDVDDALSDDANALSAIEQDGLPEAETVEELLAQLAWPPEVDGVALSVERVVLPPGAESSLPEDPVEAARVASAHPEAADVRLLVAVLRDGQATCLLRQRAHDSDDQVAYGRDIAPGLIDGLRATLLDD